MQIHQKDYRIQFWEKIILTLCNALTRPHHEYCFQFWSPYYKIYIDKLEGVQGKVNKVMPRPVNNTYEERLKELNLFSLSRQRLRGDLIVSFFMFQDIDNMDVNYYL